MKASRTLRTLRTFYSTPQSNLHPFRPSILCRFYSAEPEQEDVTQPSPYPESENDSNSVFDSSHYAIPNISNTGAQTPLQQQPTWDHKYRARADKLIFGKEVSDGKLRVTEEEEEENRRRVLAKALLEAALEKGDSEDEEGEVEGVVKEEDQKSLAVGIIGAPNAGKSALTNYVVRSL